MITLSHRKEALSAAYLQAISAKAGVNVSTRLHDYGVDGEFHSIRNINGHLQESGFSIDYQAKASKNWQIDQSTRTINYNLEGKTFNTMIERNRPGSYSQCLMLVLLCLPSQEDQWLSLSDHQLILRRCCYYHYVRATDPAPPDSKRVIQIPAANVLTPDALSDLLARKMKGEDL